MPLMTRQEFEAKVEALYQLYPLMFTDVPCGVWLLPGWVGLIERLCTEIDAAMTLKERRTFRITQIKEKFGRLRFYADGHNDRTHALVKAAETASAILCVYCGAPGAIRNYDREKKTCLGWVHPACDEHAGRNDLYSEDVL